MIYIFLQLGCAREVFFFADDGKCPKKMVQRGPIHSKKWLKIAQDDLNWFVTKLRGRRGWGGCPPISPVLFPQLSNAYAHECFVVDAEDRPIAVVAGRCHIFGG